MQDFDRFFMESLSKSCSGFSVLILDTPLTFLKVFSVQNGPPVQSAEYSLSTGIVLLECCVSAAVEELPQQHHRNVAFPLRFESPPLQTSPGLF